MNNEIKQKIDDYMKVVEPRMYELLDWMMELSAQDLKDAIEYFNTCTTATMINHQKSVNNLKARSNEFVEFFN